MRRCKSIGCGAGGDDVGVASAGVWVPFREVKILSTVAAGYRSQRGGEEPFVAGRVRYAGQELFP